MTVIIGNRKFSGLTMEKALEAAVSALEKGAPYVEVKE